MIKFFLTDFQDRRLYEQHVLFFMYLCPCKTFERMSQQSFFNFFKGLVLMVALFQFHWVLKKVCLSFSLFYCPFINLQDLSTLKIEQSFQNQKMSLRYIVNTTLCFEESRPTVYSTYFYRDVSKHLLHHCPYYAKITDIGNNGI